MLLLASTIATIACASFDLCSGVDGTRLSGTAFFPSSQTSQLRIAHASARSGHVLYSFMGAPDGAIPYSGLLALDGVLYGTTRSGGQACGCGTVYAIARVGGVYVERVIYRFQGRPNDGAVPAAGQLISGPDGTLYGTTFAGGTGTCNTSATSGCGTVYALRATHSGFTETVLYNFQGGVDGANPDTGLTIDSAGNLFGVAELGGSARCAGGCGVAYELTPTVSGFAEHVIHRFKGPPSDGAFPIAPPTIDSHGALYGTTPYGGSGNCMSYDDGCGIAYKLAPTRAAYREQTLYNFQGGADGAVAQSALTADPSGVFFGTTVFGGGGPCTPSGRPPGCGTIYKLTPRGSQYSETVVHAFQGSDGSLAVESLYETHDGRLYGTTTAGGITTCSDVSGIVGCGVAFVLTASSSGYAEKVLHEFGSSPGDGLFPAAPILEGGAMYVTTSEGGTAQLGTVTRIRR